VTCRDATDFLTDYLDGALAPETLTAFERHLSQCANCTTFLGQFRFTLKAGMACFEDEHADAATLLPRDLVDAILAALRQA
jgi:predicted anti-sigma-YlaC factor YlaD